MAKNPILCRDGLRSSTRRIGVCSKGYIDNSERDYQLAGGFLCLLTFFNNMKKPILQKTISFFVVAFIALVLTGCSKKSTVNNTALNTTPRIELSPTNNAVLNQVNNSSDSINQQKEKQYIDETKLIIKDFTDSLDSLAQLLDEKPLYASWNKNEKVMGALSSVTIEQAYDRAVKLSPPDKFTESHNLLLQSLKKYKQAMPLFRQGMDELDKQKINQSTTLMTDGASLLRQATAVMNK